MGRHMSRNRRKVCNGLCFRPAGSSRKVSCPRPISDAESGRSGLGDDDPRLDTTHPDHSRSANRVNTAACRIARRGAGNGRLGRALPFAGDLIAERTVKA